MRHPRPITRTVTIAAAVGLIVPMTVGAASAQTVSQPVSTNDSVSTVATSVTTAGTVADGQELFRGLYFGQGPVAKKLSKLDSFSKIDALAPHNSTDRAREQATRVLKTIDKKDSGFFASFSRDIRSGDPFKVEAALKSGEAKLKAATTVNTKTGQGTGNCVTVAVAAVVTVAGGINVVGAANAAVAANVVYSVNWFWGGSSKAKTNSLSQQEAAASVAKTLQLA